MFVRLQNLLHDYTYAASGLQPILTQAIKRILTQAIKLLGYVCDYVEVLGQRTTAGIQYCMRFRQNQAINSPLVGYIYEIPCLWCCEARESVLVRALHYIENDRGYCIRDIQY